jgi:cysteine-S-conjugate beta-lyase
MKYDFDTVIERRGTGAVKWDATAVDTLPMWVADMDFAAPPGVVEALQRRVAHPVFGYPMVTDRYRQSFCQWQRQRNNLEIDPAWILATPAVMPAIRACIDALTAPGDPVVVQPPVYFPFFHAVRFKAQTPVAQPAETDRGKPTGWIWTIWSRSSGAGARTLLISSPHNPVARLWTRSELFELAGLARRYDVAIISDEIHSDIILEPTSFVSMLELAPERTVACFSVSKTFNLAGIGASQTVVPDDVLRARCKAAFERDGVAVAAERAVAGGNRKPPIATDNRGSSNCSST